MDVERFLGGLKVQFRAKEIDEETYKAASDSTVEMMTRDEQERSEILFTLTWLTGTAKPGNSQDAGQEAAPETGARDDVPNVVDDHGESGNGSIKDDSPVTSPTTVNSSSENNQPLESINGN